MTGGGTTLARESDFRRVVMQSERYLTSDQLNSLILLADKNASGLIDFEEFANRLSGAAPVPGPFAPPGGAASAPGGPVQGAPPPAEEEVRAVGSRCAAVLERHGLAPERLSPLLALFGGDLPADVAAAHLAVLPIGMSRLEAMAQLQTLGSVNGFAAQLAELNAQSVWRTYCEWASTAISGPKLRDVLKDQLIEAEIRTLDPSEFSQALTDAGVAAANIPQAMWLAEKTAQGDVCVSEFLANFGGPPPAGKKKRGLFDRIMGR